MVSKNSFMLILLLALSLFFASAVSADIAFSISPVSVNESTNVQYNITVNNSNQGAIANITEIIVGWEYDIFNFSLNSNDTDSVSVFTSSVSDNFTYLNWTSFTGYVVNGSSVGHFVFNASASLSGFQDIRVIAVNGTGSITKDVSVEVESSCFAYSNNVSCNNVSGCSWDDDMFHRCGPSCELSNDPASCDLMGGYCKWNDKDFSCMFTPFSMKTFGCDISDKDACEASSNCTWESMAGECIVDCFKYDSFHLGNETTCNSAYGGTICEWSSDDMYCSTPGEENDSTCAQTNGMCNPFFFDKGFDGFSPCFDFDGNETGCNGMPYDCVWFSEPDCKIGDFCYGDGSDPGFCNPKGGFDFGKDFNCYLYDGNKDACKDAIENSQWPCSWSADPWAKLINGTEAGWCSLIFGGNGGAGGGSCWDYADESGCNSAVGLGLPCAWENSTGAECEEIGCWDYWDNESCLANKNSSGCEWESTYNYCYDVKCMDLSDESSCDASGGEYGLDCSWINNSFGGGGKCDENGCWKRDWTNQSYCEGKAGCSWDGSHCQEKGCWDFTYNMSACLDDSVTGLNCKWDNTTQGWCEQRGCDSFGGANETYCLNDSSDYGLDCTWENSSGQKDCFEQIKSCSNNDNEFACLSTNYCSWNGTACDEPAFDMGDFWNPGCWVFDQAGETKCNNVTTCSWTGSVCDDNGADNNNGVQCVDINDSTMCNNIPMLSSCCQWNGTVCQDAPMVDSCHNLQEPPVGAAFCEDYNSKNSQTLCEEIAGDPWYMPCSWDNSTEECGFAGDNMFGGNAEGFDFSDIGSQANCEASGGSWKDKQWVDENGTVFFDSWCEPKIGFDSQFCDNVCWACEKQDNGTEWSDGNASRSACEQSAAGCVYYDDSHADNGFGWCDMDMNKQGDCDSNCFECWDNTQCSDSAAGCKWFVDSYDDNFGWCDNENVKTCDDSCFACGSVANCQVSNAGCTWDAASYFCKPSGTGDGNSFEVCFDGVDNDNDGFVDCDDPSCMFDSFCGGSAVFGSDCMSIPDNDTCLNESKHEGYNCIWITDNWGNSWCDMPGAQCWTEDDNETACNLEQGCHYKTMNDSGNADKETCDVNSSIMDESQCWNYGQNESVCNAAVGCAWQTDKFCLENPDDLWCASQNSTLGFMPGWCDHEIWSCNQYDSNSSCIAAGPCAWQVDPWCFTPEGQNDPWCADSPGVCDPICFARDNDTCADNVIINGTSTSGVCELLNSTEMGWCEPENMFKGCKDYDDNSTLCGEHNESCIWISDPNTPAGGFCGDLFMHQMTGNMDKSPPLYLAEEDCLGGDNATKDICKIGIKDSPDKFGLVIKVDSMDNSTMCSDSFGSDPTFTGNKSTKFYWYLDTNGDTTGGCEASDNSSIIGMEFKFKYESTYSNGSVDEVKVAYKCINGTWSPSQVKTNAWPEKACYMIGGGVIAVDKADIKKLNGYFDESADMRIYAVTGSETSPYDTIGPSSYSPNSADFRFEDCSGFTDNDGDGLVPSEDPDCVGFLKLGYIDLEKGTECDDGIDNDGNGLIDCNDSGCMYDRYYCDSSAWENDSSAPIITWMEVNPFMDGVFVEVDSDEPTNAVLTFYKNDSYCSNASDAIIVYDAKLNNSFDLDDYDFWHDFPVDNSSAYFINGGYDIESNSTYYFKIKLCDKADNCALSACTDFTTTSNVSEYRVGFDLPSPGVNASELLGKVEVQFDWGGDGAFDDVIDGVEGFKINESQGRDVDLRFHNPNSTKPWSIDFKGADFVKAQDLDIEDAFIVNTTPGGDILVGMDSDNWKELAQALGVDEVEIIIPQVLTNLSAAKLMHCPDNVTEFSVAAGCVELNADDINCTFGVTNSTCTIPSSIGFSVLGISDTTTTVADDGDSSGGSSSSGSGGGLSSSVVNNESVDENVNNSSPEAVPEDGNLDENTKNPRGADNKGLVSESYSFWSWVFSLMLLSFVAGIIVYFIKKKD